MDLRASDQRNTISPAIVADELHILELRMEVLARFALLEEGGTIPEAPTSAKVAAACLLFMVAICIRGIMSPGVRFEGCAWEPR